MSIESEIARHYAKKESSEIARGQGHLHIGGEHATRYFLDQLGLRPDMSVLDIGCGVGGPALLAAQDYGCHVTGIDLTPDFIETARANAKTAALESRTIFQTANAGQLDFADHCFDLAIMVHVGMNIPDKEPVYQEAARVIKPGGLFAIYDILAKDHAAKMLYPCPWARSIKTSFLTDWRTTADLLSAAGLDIVKQEDRTDYAIDAITRMMEKTANTLSEFRRGAMQNLLTNIKNNACGPSIIITRKPA
tara:strand:- start:1089 stop:1835 length:747 start_codon:yes stop_codon:yes gene_type:complete